MTEQLNKVQSFHEAFGTINGEKPTLISEPEYLLRYKLLEEENIEYAEACIKGNTVEIADALGDQLYILCGTILKHGMQHIIQDVFDEIHRSNMSKLGEDGKPLLREDGKILKGPGYFKPDIKKILDK